MADTYEPPLQHQVTHYQQAVANQALTISDLQMRLNFANEIIAALQAQITKGAHSHDDDAQLSLVDIAE